MKTWNGKTPSGLIIGGRNLGGPVFNWHDTGLEVVIGDGSRRRVPKQVIDLFVWHWTGGENPVETLFRVLDQRELGVEFFIDSEGRIFQFCDPVIVDTFDAGAYNPRSVGCEIQCYGFQAPGRPLPKGGAARGTYTTRMNGRKRTFAKFYPAQIDAALWLARAVSDAIPSIPKTVPALLTGALYPNAVPFRVMESGSIKGHVGHYHLTDPEHPLIKRGKRQEKSDPGHDLLEAFLASGFAPQVVTPAP